MNLNLLLGSPTHPEVSGISDVVETRCHADFKTEAHVEERDTVGLSAMHMGIVVITALPLCPIGEISPIAVFTGHSKH